MNITTIQTQYIDLDNKLVILFNSPVEEELVFHETGSLHGKKLRYRDYKKVRAELHYSEFFQCRPTCNVSSKLFEKVLLEASTEVDNNNLNTSISIIELNQHVKVYKIKYMTVNTTFVKFSDGNIILLEDTVD